jgi:hypothetical protein
VIYKSIKKMVDAAVGFWVTEQNAPALPGRAAGVPATAFPETMAARQDVDKESLPSGLHDHDATPVFRRGKERYVGKTAPPDSAHYVQNPEDVP